MHTHAHTCYIHDGALAHAESFVEITLSIVTCLLLLGLDMDRWDLGKRMI